MRGANKKQQVERDHEDFEDELEDDEEEQQHIDD